MFNMGFMWKYLLLEITKCTPKSLMCSFDIKKENMVFFQSNFKWLSIFENKNSSGCDVAGVMEISLHLHSHISQHLTVVVSKYSF